VQNRWDAISPLDYRFVGGDAKLQKELGPYLSAGAVIRYQARVEGALALAMADAKVLDHESANAIASAADQITPQEVADTVLWLASPGSASVNGQAIVVAGGEVMAG